MGIRGKKLREWLRVRLEDLRDHSNPSLNNKEFAKKAGLSVEHYYKLLRGGSSPTVETLADWLSACGTNLPRLFAEMEAGNDHETNETNRFIMELCSRAVLFESGRNSLIPTLVLLFPDESERLQQLLRRGSQKP